MAFFPRELYAKGSGFTPLFRLLEDFDDYSRQAKPQHRHRVPTFQPKFDVRETGDIFQLHGELPGLNKKDVHIEFTDLQTLVIRGRIERSYHTGMPVAAPEDTEMTGATSKGDETEKAHVSHQAHVEDEKEDEADTSSIAVVTPTTTVADIASAEPVKETKPVDKAKYWVSERSIGEFSRIFNFPVRVSQDQVTAKLDDGILTVTIPKAPKHEALRISIA